jgi:hypothetical protein
VIKEIVSDLIAQGLNCGVSKKRNKPEKDDVLGVTLGLFFVEKAHIDGERMVFNRSHIPSRQEVCKEAYRHVVKRNNRLQKIDCGKKSNFFRDVITEFVHLPKLRSILGAMLFDTSDLCRSADRRVAPDCTGLSS